MELKKKGAADGHDFCKEERLRGRGGRGRGARTWSPGGSGGLGPGGCEEREAGSKTGRLHSLARMHA